MDGLGNFADNQESGYVPGHSPERKFKGTESKTMYQLWDRFIDLLVQRNYSDKQIALILGGNYIRIWKEILPG